jgi:hypothetical protein
MQWFLIEKLHYISVCLHDSYLRSGKVGRGDGQAK